MRRLLTATVLVGVVLAGIRLAPVWVFWTGMCLLALVAFYELGRLLEAVGKRPWPIVGAAGTLATMAAFFWRRPAVAEALTAVLMVCLVRLLLSRRDAVTAVERFFGTLGAVLYLGLTLGHVGGLLVGELDQVREVGEDLLVFALVVVYFGDTCAFYGGRWLGRHALAPRISPAKTWEGAVCGLLGSLAGALLGPLWFFQDLPLAHALGLGVLLSAAGVTGDLCESAIKRAAQVKDSGHLLPGHGGVLDRIDSLLLAAPALYWYHRLVL